MGWKCLDTACGFPMNFSSKTECFKCQTPRGEAVEYELPAKGEKGERKNMGWKCLDTACGYPTNFKSKTECFKCQTPRGEAVEYELPEKGNPNEKREKTEKK